jgi:hypothetical protein
MRQDKANGLKGRIESVKEDGSENFPSYFFEEKERRGGTK